MASNTLQRHRQDQINHSTARDLRRQPVRVLSRMLLDQSGSMRAHKVDLLEGAADFLEAMREQTLTSLVAFDLFDDQFDRGDSALAQQTPYLTEERYNGGGDTALFDAILKTIDCAAREENPATDRVLISIFTDGHDTCSRASLADARVVIAEKQQQGWVFVFSGPNRAVGTDLGIPASNVFQLKGSDIKGVLSQMIQRTVTLLLPPVGGTIQL